MKRGRIEKLETSVSLIRQRPIQILIALGLMYMIMVMLEIPLLFKYSSSDVSHDFMKSYPRLNSKESFGKMKAPIHPLEEFPQNADKLIHRQLNEHKIISGLVFNNDTFYLWGKDRSSQLYKSAKNAWILGNKMWKELETLDMKTNTENSEQETESCPTSISLSGTKFMDSGLVMVIPCGLTLGSLITVVGKPQVVKSGETHGAASQFVMELQGLKVVDGEDPPRILHFNPRLRGDWSQKPVIEQNTRYRMHWGSAQRCDGRKSMPNEETGK